MTKYIFKWVTNLEGKPRFLFLDPFFVVVVVVCIVSFAALNEMENRSKVPRAIVGHFLTCHINYI